MLFGILPPDLRPREGPRATAGRRGRSAKLWPDVPSLPGYRLRPTSAPTSGSVSRQYSEASAHRLPSSTSRRSPRRASASAVAGDGLAATARQPFQHPPPRLPLGYPPRLRSLHGHGQPAAMLHQHMPGKAEPRRLVFAFARKLGLRIRRRGMCSVGAPLSVVVHARIPASVWRPLVVAVSPPQTLKRGPGFEERAVDTEVIVRQQVLATRLFDELEQEAPGDILRQKPFLVFGEGRGVEGLIVNVQVQKPLEKHVVLELITEAAGAGDREKRHQKLRLEQMLRWNRGTAHAGVDTFKDQRQLRQRPIHDRFDLADGVVHRHQLVGSGHRHHHLPSRLAAHLILPALETVSLSHENAAI